MENRKRIKISEFEKNFNSHNFDHTKNINEIMRNYINYHNIRVIPVHNYGRKEQILSHVIVLPKKTKIIKVKYKIPEA